MASYVWISWIRFVNQQLMSILVITTNYLVLSTSKKLSGFLNLRCYSLQLTLMKTKFLLDRIYEMVAMMLIEGHSVGAGDKVNCNQFNYYGMVTKKNTQICRLDVLAVVHNSTDWILINPIVAHRNNTCNYFAGCCVRKY